MFKKTNILTLLFFALMISTGCEDSNPKEIIEVETPKEEVIEEQIIEEPKPTLERIPLENGDVFFGYTLDGVKHGDGEINRGDNTLYGVWDNGELLNPVIIEYDNGDRYEGTYLEVFEEGYGTYYFDNGDIYEGMFLGEVFSGEGTLTFDDGDYVKGTFKVDAPFGNCISYMDGDIFIANMNGYHDSEEGLYIYKDGSVTGTKLINGEWIDSEIERPLKENDEVYLKDTLPIVNLTDYIDTYWDKLNIYEDESSSISYVNVYDLFTLVDSNFKTPYFEYSDTLDIYYAKSEYESNLYGHDYYVYQMTIDSEENTISFNDADMRDFWMYDEFFETNELTLVDFKHTVEDNSLSIDLDDYGRDILTRNGYYFIPLDIIPFIIQDTLYLYETNEQLIVGDQTTFEKDEFAEIVDAEMDKDYFNDFDTNISSYLTLLFDLDYGLEDFNQIDEQLEIQEFSDAIDIDEFNYALYQFIQTLEDPHTNMIYGGYVDPYYYYNEFPKLDSKFYEETEVMSQVIDDVTVIKFDSFDYDSIEEVVTFLKEATTEKVAFDITSNGGGSVTDMIKLLAYLTDEPIVLRTMNTVTSTIYEEYYELNNNEYIEKEYYLFTSNSSYSAANAFASIFKDQEIGTIIGTKTSGGACIVDTEILPMGIVITMSGDKAIINKDLELIEEGIVPDIHIDGVTPGRTYLETLIDAIE